MKTVTITGNNAIDVDIKVQAINVLKELPADELDRLATLAKSPNARKKFMSNWNMIKRLTGIK